MEQSLETLSYVKKAGPLMKKATRHIEFTRSVR
jgi:hypothetical protein